MYRVEKSAIAQIITMNLDIILYFALGFLAAALLALMLAPAIWNRAVALTRHRIENSVPLTLNEIQAEKDQLRAEFAMSTRRLEMTIDELNNKASAQMIEINRKRADVDKLDSDGKKRRIELEKLEHNLEDLNRQLEDRESALDMMKERNEELELRHSNLVSEIQVLQSQSQQDSASIEARDKELAANKSALTALRSEIDGEKADTENTRLAVEIEKLQNLLQAERAKFAEVSADAKEAKRSLNEAKKEISRKSKDIGESRKGLSDNNDEISNLNSRLLNEQARNVELEAKLAKSALQMESLLDDASNENVKRIVEGLRGELQEKADIVQSLKREREKLATELEAAKAAANADWSTERQEKAILRERINDLAAQVAAITANKEGPDSPINKMLEEAEANPGKKKSGKQGSIASLADRIRAIQQEANS